MIKLKVGDKEIIVESNWDSGTHKGFTLRYVDEYDRYVAKSADKFLSKEQIEVIEYAIVGIVADLLQGDE